MLKSNKLVLFLILLAIVTTIVVKKRHKIERQYAKLVKIYKYYRTTYATKIYFDKVDIGNFNLNGKKIKVTKYFSPLLSYVEAAPSTNTRGFIQFYRDNFFKVIGSGGIYFTPRTNLNEINLDEITLNKIHSNLESIIGKEFLKNYPNNVQHFLIEDKKFYISYLKKLNENCYYGEVLVANYDLNFLDFKIFYSLKECNDRPGITAGRLSSFNENEILYSTGDIGKKNKPQSKQSLYGKILKINKLNNTATILSSGLRDPQGLFYSKDDDVIFSTDHGPIGGDEVNFQSPNKEKIVNFGWPISSYGYHNGSKDKDYKKKYPHHKSHEQYNFKEPLFHANKISIPPTQVIVANNFIKSKDRKVLYFGSLGWNIKNKQRSIHQLILNNSLSLVEHNIIPVDERVRDLVLDKINNKIFFTFKNSLGIIEVTD